jgi:hypothetical protein
VLPLIPLIMVGGIFTLWVIPRDILVGGITYSVHYIYMIATKWVIWGVFVSSHTLVTRYVMLLWLLTVYILIIRYVRVQEDRKI